jgi:hypothetical protein
MSDAALLTAEIAAPPLADDFLDQPSAAAAPEEVAPTSSPAAALPETDSPPPALAADQRASLLAAVSAARDLPPGVRDRLARLVEQASTLDATGEPLLATRGVLDLLAQGIPAVLRRETPAPVSRLEHPIGDTFFALSADELSDQQAEQIARAQLQRAGLLR